jgi:hypothetical protein
VVVEPEALFWAVVVALMLATVLLGLAAGVVAISAVARGQGRGYRPAGLAVGVLAVVVGAGGAATVALAGVLDTGRPSPLLDVLPILGVVPISGAALLGAVLVWLGANALPARLVRRPGMRPRRHRYGVWSLLTVPLTIGFAAWVWWSTDDFSLALRVVLLGAAVGIALRRLERRLGAQLPAVPPDTGGHVLYLRPFRTEGRAQFQLPSRRADATGQGSRRWVPLDEFLVRGAGERLGPVIALGNPTEFLPPGGATRVYLSDDRWQEELAGLADRAALIVMQPGRTRSMRWELEHVVGAGLHGKFFVLTPPRPRFPGLTRRATALMDWVYGWRPPSWPEFLGELADVGLDAGAADPGPGAVIGFRSDGSGVVVARDLAAAPDFADAMLQHTR